MVGEGGWTRTRPHTRLAASPLPPPALPTGALTALSGTPPTQTSRDAEGIWKGADSLVIDSGQSVEDDICE